ncbi:YdeI/OmpD-associated family protein [Aquabacterium sp.]|uniref:YdeI/OmpD-associated family protein n=1 Tax=Aquabacterium sp. TaxID=1872578 RepID=UPI002C596136|nr:YdeI/OmpD-associated family protein [Aquabacterium sp.]HSW07825.1 YdeI/OmpD-associated family protein [Aquabacterium sp.]
MADKPPTAARYFATPDDFRAWFQQHAATATELLVGFHKRGSDTPSISWPESVDEALCVGWIDGVRKRIDDARYSIRFTPRKPTSTWSAINIERVRVLTEQGRMTPAGLAAFAHRKDAKSGTYAYEQAKTAELDAKDVAAFKKHKAAWAYFQAQPPGYRHLVIWRVVSAKQQATRERRLAQLIEACQEQRRIE